MSKSSEFLIGTACGIGVAHGKECQGVNFPEQVQIGGGRIITTLGMTPFEVAVYKVGDKYVASRSNECGFANYEIETGKP